MSVVTRMVSTIDNGEEMTRVSILKNRVLKNRGLKDNLLKGRVLKN